MEFCEGQRAYVGIPYISCIHIQTSQQEFLKIYDRSVMVCNEKRIRERVACKVERPLVRFNFSRVCCIGFLG